MARIGLAIEPLDALFFRDGRPFDGQPRAMSGLPLPQTLAGALRTWLLRERGCDLAALAKAVKEGASFADALAKLPGELGEIGRLSFRGPWLWRDGATTPLVPVPAILRRIKDGGEIVRLAPLKDHLPGWEPPEDRMQPLWCRRREPTERIEGLLTLDGLRKLLDGCVPINGDVVRADEFFGFDRRTGIVVGAATRTAAESEIYGVSLLVLADGVSFYAEIAGDDAALATIPAAGIIPFGGEGRRVRVTRMNAPCDWPSAPDKNGRTMRVLTAPAPFGGWQPPGLQPIAAAVPGHVAVSGWDLARGGPKPNRFAVAAGSVYFFDQPLDDRPVAGSLCDGEDGTVGWGTFVEGGWEYA